MITLNATIRLPFSGTLSSATTDITFEKNNISSPLSSVVNSENIKGNPFIIGSSLIGDGSTLSDGEDFFISSAFYREGIGFVQDNGDGIETSIRPSLLISGQDITAFAIEFDSENGRHPNRIQINEVEYSVNDTNFTVVGLARANYHTVYIKDWNAENYPIVIKAIYISLSIDINDRNLISLNRSISDRSDITLPSYGILSNTGNIEFNDLNGDVRNYAEQLILTSGLKVEISLNNTLSKSTEKVASFETKDWSYDNDNRSVTVSIQDDLEEWQNIALEGIPFLETINSMYYVCTSLIQLTPIKWEFNISDNIYSYLKTISCRNISFEKGSLWSFWTKFCEVTCLHLYKDFDGKIVLSADFGV